MAAGAKVKTQRRGPRASRDGKEAEESQRVLSAATFSLILISILFLAGCSTPLFASPTATATATLTPTNTPAPTQTATPTKTLTATPRPLIEMGERHEIAKAGFSVRVPKGYASQIEEQQAFI